jgi:DNA polymerase III subunit gamma/tau
VAGNLALYRKYRSATFGEVIGQEHVTEPLRHALANGRINHAYLFSGPRGCGKTSSARILARSLNCVQGPTPDPCGVCDSCRELAPNGPGSIDVIEIDAASHGGVDDARDLRERAFFAPVRDRFKVYIIDEAHMVTTQGFNALLKLVEEPPDFLVFVFATTEPDKVLTTIRSRTHHYPFRLIPPGTMRAHLETICAAEKIVVEPAVLPLVVRAGGGSVRDALSILDQLIAGAGPDGVTYARAVALLGVTDSALLDEMVDALAAGDAASVYGTVDRVVEAGHDPRRFAADLLDRFRDLILLDAVPEAATRGLIDEPQDALARMVDQARRLGAGTLTRFAEIVHTALIEMRGTTSPRLVLELLCARMQLPDASTDAAALLQRVERLERRHAVTSEGAAEAAPPAATAPAAQSPAKPTTQQPATPATQPSTAPATQPPATPATQSPTKPRPSAAPSPAEAATPSPAEAATPSPAEAVAPPTAAPESAPATPPTRPPTAGAGRLDAPALRRLWPDVLEIVRNASKTTWAMLDAAQITAVDGERVTLAVAPSLAKRIAEDRNTSLISSALAQVVGGAWQIDVQASATAQPPPSKPTPEPQPRRQAPAAAQAATPRASQPEPDPRDDTEPDTPADARAAADPEADALRLLEDQLGARPVRDQTP